MSTEILAALEEVDLDALSPPGAWYVSRSGKAEDAISMCPTCQLAKRKHIPIPDIRDLFGGRREAFTDRVARVYRVDPRVISETIIPIYDGYEIDSVGNLVHPSPADAFDRVVRSVLRVLVETGKLTYEERIMWEERLLTRRERS